MRKAPSISGYDGALTIYCFIDHIIFNVGNPSLEARNIRLVNIITYIIE
jgi:hypothetical protein